MGKQQQLSEPQKLGRSKAHWGRKRASAAPIQRSCMCAKRLNLIEHYVYTMPIMSSTKPLTFCTFGVYRVGWPLSFRKSKH
jgi:hypothetical protein